MLVSLALHDALTRVVSVANGKGGAGKTTTACNVAGLAALAGWRVLLVDLDPQGNAGHLLGYTWAGESDGGRHLVDALRRKEPLRPTLEGVRPGLDVVCGGAELDDLEAVLTGRISKGEETGNVLAWPLAQVAPDYDLVIMDTPPTRPLLLRLALSASRWIVVPTRAGRMSIEGLRAMARDVAAAREFNPKLEVLGAVLYDVETNATVIRRNAVEDVETVLDGAAPVFHTVIRHAQAVAVRGEEQGELAHEMAEKVDGAEPWWKALREGRRPERLPGSAPALAEDFVLLTQEILTRIDEQEKALEVSA